MANAKMSQDLSFGATEWRWKMDDRTLDNANERLSLTNGLNAHFTKYIFNVRRHNWSRLMHSFSHFDGLSFTLPATVLSRSPCTFHSIRFARQVIWRSLGVHLENYFHKNPHTHTHTQRRTFKPHQTDGHIDTNSNHIRWLSTTGAKSSHSLLLLFLSPAAIGNVDLAYVICALLSCATVSTLQSGACICH